jgi:hypothetical protein
VTRRWQWIVIGVACLAFAIKIVIALNTRGSNDVTIWEAHLAKIQSAGALAWYRDGVKLYGADGHFLGVEVSNHPVLAFRMVSAFDRLARITHLPFGFWLRFATAAADLASVFILRAILAGSRYTPSNVTLLLVAASPVSLMISGFHGNTDPIMVCLLLLSIWLAESRRPPWLAGAAFGLAMSIKVVPVVFAPVFLMFFPSARTRLKFALSAALVFAAGSMPYLLQNPALVLGHQFGYSPEVEEWGVPGLGHILLPKAFDAIYRITGKAILALALLFTAFRMNRPWNKPTLLRQCGIVCPVLLFLATGFSVQYLAWLVPWSAGDSRKRITLYYLASSAFLFTVYTVWCGGFPWNFGNSLEYTTSFAPGLIMFSLEVLTWISIGLLLRQRWREHVLAIPDKA